MTILKSKGKRGIRSTKQTLKLVTLVTIYTFILVSAFSVLAANAEGGLEGYVGSDTCLICHSSATPEIVEKWNDSQHGNVSGNAYPLSRGVECAGCHSTNYDPVTGTYTEPRQGCEVCHGPGAEHVSGPSEDNIFRSTDSSVCGQCHNRHGESLTYIDPESEAPVGYPVGYTPDKVLEEFYESASLDDLHSFWPTGHAAYSHGNGGMQYPEWKQSRHSEVGVECVLCHDPHGSVGYEKQLLKAEDELCVTCHKSQEKINAGTGGEGVPEMPWVMEDLCVQCHMPQVGITHSGEAGTGRSHTWEILFPEEAEAIAGTAEEVEHPEEEEEEHIHIPASSCSECHSIEGDDFGVRFQPLIEERQSTVSALLSTLEGKIDDASYSTTEARQLLETAEGNVELVSKDESNGWHNYYYSVSILNEADQLIDQATDVEDFITTNTDLESQVSQLETEKTDLTGDVTSLETEVSGLEAEVEDLSRKAAGLTTNLAIGGVAGLIVGAIAVYFVTKR